MIGVRGDIEKRDEEEETRGHSRRVTTYGDLYH